MGLTTDPNDPRLKEPHASPDSPGAQHAVYLVMSPEELAKGYTRPFRDAYRHTKCNTVTTMGYELSATYARDPKFYGSTYCVACRAHFPVSEFTWTKDGKVVGS